MVGEAWTVIQGSGTTFSDQTKPTVMVQMGASGSNGTLEVTDMIFGTEGGSAGAIVVEWNFAEGGQGTAGMWDTHIRLEMASLCIRSIRTHDDSLDSEELTEPTSNRPLARMELVSSQLQNSIVSILIATPVNFPSCAAAFLGLHLTNTSTAYLEVSILAPCIHETC